MFKYKYESEHLFNAFEGGPGGGAQEGKWGWSRLDEGQSGDDGRGWVMASNGPGSSRKGHRGQSTRTVNPENWGLGKAELSRRMTIEGWAWQVGPGTGWATAIKDWARRAGLGVGTVKPLLLSITVTNMIFTLYSYTFQRCPIPMLGPSKVFCGHPGFSYGWGDYFEHNTDNMDLSC